MPFELVRVVTGVRISFHFMGESYILCGDCIWFIPSSLGGHLACFHLVAAVSNAVNLAVWESSPCCRLFWVKVWGSVSLWFWFNFSNCCWCWASFGCHGYFSLFLGDMSLWVLCLFLHWVVEWQEFSLPGVSPSSDIWFANILSHSVGCLFTLLPVSFDAQKF